MNPNECLNQLDWSAFCYAAGEMSVEEAERFEARLSNDQTAREALARAVELTQTVVAAESQADSFITPASRKIADWGSRLSWMAIGGLASVLIALVWSGTIGTSSTGPSDKQLALASAWTQARADIAQAKEDGLWLPSTWSLGEADEELLVGTDASADLPMGETPSWMTAALAGIADQSTETNAEPFTNERGEN